MPGHIESEPEPERVKSEMSGRYSDSLLLSLHQCQGVNMEADHVQLVRPRHESTLELKSMENLKKNAAEFEKHFQPPALQGDC